MKKIIFLLIYFILLCCNPSIASANEVGTDHFFDLFQEENKFSLSKDGPFMVSICKITPKILKDRKIYKIDSVITFDDRIEGVEIQRVEFQFFDSLGKMVRIESASLDDFKIMSERTLGLSFGIVWQEEQLTCQMEVLAYGYIKKPKMIARPVEFPAIRRIEPIATTTNPNKVP